MKYSLPIIHINDNDYPAAIAKRPDSVTPSQLQLLFGSKYGTESFEKSLADFLTEWFDEKETLKVHTSGSTGKPKELWVEKQRMMNSAQATVSFLGLKEGDSALLCMPLPYIAGKMVVVRSLISGLNLQLVTPCGHPLTHVTKVPDFAAMTPMQVFNTLEVPTERERLKQIKHLIIGGGAVDTEMAETLLHFPNAVWSTYGMTETLSHIALRRLSGDTASSWYTPFEGVNVSMSTEKTLVIHAPKVCPEILHTNDIVTFNEKGQFRILGRKDNTINTGGIKVQIEEVEIQLRKSLSIPFLITAAPDPKFGEQIVLLIESVTTTGCGESFFSLKGKEGNNRKDNPVWLAQVKAAINTLPTFWQPRSIIVVSHLPLTGTGKPDRSTAKQIASKMSSMP